MRTFVLMVGLAVGAACGSNGWGQGTVNFNTRVPASGINAPLTLSTGGFATGPQYVGILLGGATGGAMAPLGTPTPFRTGALAGHLAGGTVTIPNIPPGGPASVQILAFDSTLYTDAAAAAAAAPGSIGIARSVVLNLTKTGDPTAVPPGLPMDLVGLTWIVVPEPSVMTLGVVGAWLLVGWRLTRRRGGRAAS